MNNIFYVYIYLDPRRPGSFIYKDFKFNFEPFYVGKGKHKQHLNHILESKNNFKNGNQFKLNKIRKIIKETGSNPIVIKLIEGLSEDESFKLESETINSIGRKDLNLGPLVNMTNGGDGISGYRFSEESKINRSNRMKGSNNKFYGKTHNEEFKIAQSNRMKNNNPNYKDGVVDKIRISNTGKIKSMEERNNISKRMLGDNNPMKNKDTVSKVMKTIKDKGSFKNNENASNNWIVISPENIELQIRNLAKFCRENNLSKESMSYVSSGKQISHKGWRCIKLESKRT